MAQTPLGKIVAGAAKPGAPAPSVSALATFLSLGSRGAYATLPKLGRVWIELASHDVLNEIEAAALAHMRDLLADLNSLTASMYEADKYVRVLAWAVRDEKDHAQHFGTVEEWAGLDSDLLAACQTVYVDIRSQLDPLGESSWAKLTEEQRAGVRMAVEKKSRILLLSYGAAVLSSYLLSTEFPLATSQTPKSSPGEPSSES